MKTPLTYYGGKQNMVDIILPLLSPHRLYCETFAGGAAVFFAKLPSTEEILNDTNSEMVNFWEVLKRDFDALALEVHKSLHSRSLHRQAGVIYANPDMFDRVRRAWAVWYLLSTSFNAQFNTTMATDLYRKRKTAFNNKKWDFSHKLSERISNTRIESYDAVKVIHDVDSVGCFFYVDPPYVGADQGHYAGYTQSAFDFLLEALSGITGKFLLSSYPNRMLSECTLKNGWYQLELKMHNSASSSILGYKTEKTEVLTANYPIAKNHTPELFD